MSLYFIYGPCYACKTSLHWVVMICKQYASLPRSFSMIVTGLSSATLSVFNIKLHIFLKDSIEIAFSVILLGAILSWLILCIPASF